MIRVFAIILAVMGLWLSALQASAQPRRGGWRMGRGRPFMSAPRAFDRGGFARPGFGRGAYGGFGPGRFGGRRFGGPGFAPPPVGGYGAPGFSGGGYGGRGMDSGWRAEQDQVRQAVREGRHIPLNQAIEAVRRRAPGRELDAGLETAPDGRQVYRLRWAGQGGRRQDYLVDAGTGQVLGVQPGGAPEGGGAWGGP